MPSNNVWGLKKERDISRLGGVHELQKSMLAHCPAVSGLKGISVGSKEGQDPEERSMEGILYCGGCSVLWMTFSTVLRYH